MSANKLSYEKFTKQTAKELRKTYDRLQRYERVTNSLRKVYETIRNSLVTFSSVHFTRFCKLGPRFATSHVRLTVAVALSVSVVYLTCCCRYRRWYTYRFSV